MTITVNDTRDEYTATAGQTVFNYTFKIFEDTDLLVYQTASGITPDDATDLITAYTVTGVGSSAGGTIVLTTGATLNDKITIVSAIPEKRTTDYQYNADFSADVVNDDFDRVVSLVKQAKEDSSRTLKFSKSAQGTTGKVLPQPSDLADCVLAFDSSGNPVAGPSSTSMQTLIDAAEAVLLNSNAGAVSATTIDYPAIWTSTNVQDFMDFLIKGGAGGADVPTIKRTLKIDSGTGKAASYSQYEISLGTSASSTRSTILTQTGDTVLLYLYDSAAATKSAYVTISAADGARFTLAGSTSGENVVFEAGRTAGYISTMSTTAVQQKIAEWNSVAFKATKAFQLPTYANLAAINAAITAPVAGMLCYVTGQGMAIYKASWVRTTDETTAIT